MGASHECCGQIIDSLASGVVAVDAQGRIVTSNPAARLFLGCGEDGLPEGGLLSEESAAAPLTALFEEVACTRTPVTRRELALRASGQADREIGVSATLRIGESAFNGVIFLFADLTERRRLERAAQLNRQLAQLGELTAGIVHELRNPVSIISGMAELLIRKSGDDPDRRAPAEAILREASNLERSIGQFLGLARPFDIATSACHPCDVARRALQFCQRRAHHKGVELCFECEPRLPETQLDAERMAQAVANIVVNAVDAVPVGGHVHLSVFAEGAEIVFEISDDGPGIDPAVGEDIYKPFFTQKEAGTGLGLTIAYRTIMAHEGLIHHTNRPEGGAVFQVRVPAGGCPAT